MSVHLIKLCVGIESISHLSDRQAARVAAMAAKGETAELRHRTRQMPRRRDELLDGGSIYWVIKGSVSVRQGLLDLRQVRCDDGIRRCDLILDPQLVPTRPRPRRAFQGWRYLSAGDAPKDLGLSDAEAKLMPEAMRSELIELGLL
ncbi:MAG TPA: DUF1489 family protein [Rhizobiales bacterium]|nr:hypothetical protein BMS3Bbin10_02610 [bacterium BMS3Bbin10]HDO52980.1 DUF1489 family protein [Hyphomicrobiales bacterium]